MGLGAIMTGLALFTRSIPLIIGLVKTVEAVTDESGAGEQKKKVVMETTKTLFDVMDAVSTGGQKETWSKMEAPASGLIDLIAKFLFK